MALTYVYSAFTQKMVAPGYRLKPGEVASQVELTTTEWDAQFPQRVVKPQHQPRPVSLSGLTPTDIFGLTETQISGLTSDQIAGLTTTQLSGFSSSVISSLTTTQLAGLTSAHTSSVAQANAQILRQITELEIKQARPVREIALGLGGAAYPLSGGGTTTPFAALQDIEAQILALRTKLTHG